MSVKCQTPSPKQNKYFSIAKRVFAKGFNTSLSFIITSKCSHPNIR